MKLEDAKKKYSGEWIAFRVYREGENPEGKVIFHHKDKRKFDSELITRKIKDVYVTFGGSLIPKGYTVIF
ncbi:MAG: hypothetical protein AB1779_01630 [Candidatus Thermoplasmatota archaeon]